MEMNGEQIIKKGKKAPSWIITMYAICIAAIVIAIGIMTYRNENEKPEPIDFTTNGAVGMDIDKYAFLEIEGLTDEVAIYGNENENDSSNDRYYIAISGGYLYLVDLDFDTLEQLKAWQDYTFSEDENAVPPEPVTIYGMTEQVPTELKQYAIDYYNNFVSEEYQVSLEYFENIFGSVLLNVRREPVDTSIEGMVILLASMGIFIILIVHISVTITSKRTIKYLKKNGYEEEVARQLDDCVEEKHYKDKVILTRDFLVDIQNGITAFKYSDVKWIHVHNVKSYGITVSSSIVVHLRDGKTNLQCVEIKGNATDEFVEVFNKICEKASPDTLKGYTQENIKEFKQYKKELKNQSL